MGKYIRHGGFSSFLHNSLNIATQKVTAEFNICAPDFDGLKNEVCIDIAGGQKRKSNKSQKNAGPRPQLFEDTSAQQGQPYGYPQPQGYPGPGVNPNVQGPPGPGFPGQQFISDPVMANMAMQYGSSLADQGKDYMNKNIEKIVTTSRLKYYFAVDTTYVSKKLALLSFPFTHSDWSLKFNQEEPVAPRYEVNAPDLYIPVMAFVTYILVTGVVLGIQSRFTPEQIGIQASTALVWMIIELLAVLLSLYIMNVNTDLKYLDVIAYLGYKYIGSGFVSMMGHSFFSQYSQVFAGDRVFCRMIACLVSGLMFQGGGYYLVLLWFSLCIVFFLVRTLKVQILPRSDSDGFTRGTKRSLYLILSISFIQPIMMWWLTSHIMFYKK